MWWNKLDMNSVPNIIWSLTFYLYPFYFKQSDRSWYVPFPSKIYLSSFKFKMKVFFANKFGFFTSLPNIIRLFENFAICWQFSPYFLKKVTTRPGSIRSSPRYGLSTPYRLTIRNSARLFHHVLFNMGDLHLVLPALNLCTLNGFYYWCTRKIDDVLT